MNIIIPSLDTNSIRITGATSSDINLVRLYIATSLITNPTEENIGLLLESSVAIDDLVADTYYSLIVTYAPSLNRQGYYCYTLASELSIPSMASGYKATITIGDSSFVISSALSISNELEDEEETCVINNRTIGAIKTTIVAEDRNSQQLSYLIREKYDGVYFLDENKKIYADYIPLDKTLLSEEVNFLSDEIIEKTPVEKNGEKWLLLRWNLPPAVTKFSGTIKYAFSVVSNDQEYIWQTLPSSFTISANLGRRPSIPVEAPAQLSQLNELTQSVDELTTLMGYQSDEDPNNDIPLTISAGTAGEV